MDFSHVSVLCVGDVMLDRFVEGDIERISPEAPVPVIRLRESREMLGGVGNVANNIAALGGCAVLVGLLGADEPGAAVRRIAAHHAGITAAFVETRRRPTICKTRFIAARQQIVRTDDESTLPLQEQEEADLVAAVETHLPLVRAVVLSDYGKGALSSRLLASLIGTARARGIPVFVDPKSLDFSRYRGATCITPNAKELAAAAGLPAGSEAEVVAASRKVMAAAEADAILATRSEKGMILIERGADPISVPARAREVFDVSGAGDTVIATMALSHASGRSLSQSMRVANAAAGVVVSKRGTATAQIDEVIHELDAQDHAQSNTPTSLMSVERACVMVRRWKEQGLQVGFTNGCFDIVHAGHVALLAAARRECDRLIVALNTDASVRRLKGPARPINALPMRAEVIAAIRYVDGVVGFDEDTPFELIAKLLPDVLVKGADYTIDRVVGADLVQAAGGRTVLAELVPGQSTTNVINRITRSELAEA